MTSQVPTSPTDNRPENQHFHHAPDQTELARFLSRLLTKIEPYTNLILIGFITVTIVGVGLIWWSRTEDASRSAGWQRFLATRAPDDFVLLANEYGNSKLGHWARLEAGRGFLDEGLSLATTNRSASDERLTHAKDAFQQLLTGRAQVSAGIREEALFGMATTLEVLSGGETEPAVQAYQQLVQEFPNSRHVPWAQNRIDVLQSSNAEQFYAWFRAQDLKPSDRPAPRDFQSLFDPEQLQLEMPTPPETPEAETPAASESDTAPASERAPDADQPPSPALPQKREEASPPASDATPDEASPKSPESSYFGRPPVGNIA